MKALPKITTAKSLVGSLVAVALMAWGPLQTRADTVAFSISGGQPAGSGNVTVGYAFTLSSTVTVTNLGLFDLGNNGLAESHAVTIWTSTGTQLVQATIPAGTGGTFIDDFRYVSITHLTLTAGTYVIGGFYGDTGDLFIDSAGTAVDCVNATPSRARNGSR